MEAIVLAGGLGTRLRSVVKGIPKPMALINKKPFLSYILSFLSRNWIEKIILSVGYKHEFIKNYFGNMYGSIKIEYSIEETPLGTGGAIKQALAYCSDENVFIINGDTYFDIELRKFYNFHISVGADVSFALKQVEDNSRYGTVKVSGNGKIISFGKENFGNGGLINGGIYLLAKKYFLNKVENFNERFSFENDFIPFYVNSSNFYGQVFNSYFIDIGVPEDYEKAVRDFMENNIFEK